jgi:hypothetical protein
MIDKNSNSFRVAQHKYEKWDILLSVSLWNIDGPCIALWECFNLEWTGMPVGHGGRRKLKLKPFGHKIICGLVYFMLSLR